jgi:hypothetical protein
MFVDDLRIAHFSFKFQICDLLRKVVECGKVMVTRSGKVPPVAKVPALLWLTDEGKMGLTKRELATVDETHQGKYAVWIRETKASFWKVEIHVDETGRTYELDTTRGGTKGWRHMEDALKFVRANCTRARTVRIELDGWALEKAGEVRE